MEREWEVVIICAIGIIVLIGSFVIYQVIYLNNLSNNYALTSNGQIIVNDDNMSLSIDNSNANSSRIIEIDGVDNIAKAKIYSSNLRTSSGDHFGSNITISPSSENSGLAKFTPDRNLTREGSYDGWLNIKGQKNVHIIPINVSSPPMLPQALIIVLIGSVSSIAFWDIIHYYGRKNTQEKNRVTENKADEIFESARNETDKLEKNSLLQRATSLKNQRDSKRSKEKSIYETKAGTAKVTFSAAASSAFGIIVALLGLLNNDYLMGITFLNFQDIGVLFGLGFGAASLKELIIKTND